MCWGTGAPSTCPGGPRVVSFVIEARPKRAGHPRTPPRYSDLALAFKATDITVLDAAEHIIH